MNTDDQNAAALARAAIRNGHERLNAPDAIAHSEAAHQLARETSCAHCDVLAEPVPVQGVRWVVQEHHALDCPRHDANTPGIHADPQIRLPPGWTTRGNGPI